MIVHIAIPAMNEADFIQQTLDALQLQQTSVEMQVYVCVNQPENYWNNPDFYAICENNLKTLSLLQQVNTLNLTLLDHSSVGKGWTQKKYGVGMARKVLMDFIAERASADDVVISLDADTIIPPLYVQSIVDSFAQFPEAKAISVPYFHQLTGKLAEDCAILRYEIYMRNYAIQLLLIDFPFAFTALGSAMAFRISAYHAIGGMSPMKSGEDFYFLQQLKKFGPLLIHNPQKVFPAARFSNRVFFGTGPAMIKGNLGNWDSYPIYHYSLFDEVILLCDSIPALYDDNLQTESLLYSFLQLQFKTPDFLNPIRKNCTSLAQFYRAFYTKVDGLRVLQFLKSQQAGIKLNDRALLLQNYPDFNHIDAKYPPEIDLAEFSIQDLSEIRLKLVEVEDLLLMQKKIIL